MAGSSRQDGAPSKKLGVLGFAAIMFFAVSGGPMGTEGALQAAGALPVLLGVVILTLIWAIPESMVTAELATAFPEDSGYVAWCSVAFGDFWGWMNGWLSILQFVVGNASFLVLITDYVQLVVPALEHGTPRIVFLLLVALLLTGLNYLGLDLVGWSQMVNVGFVMAPFLVLAVVCWRQGSISNMTKVADNIDWSTYIVVMFWNLNYWSLGANLAGEVDNPPYTFPRSLALAVLAVMLSYLIPIASITRVETNFGDWQLGAYGEIAGRLAGKWLQAWIVVAAIAGNTGLYWSCLSAGSYLVLGMAERGFLPRPFTWRSRFGTPILGVWLHVLPAWGLSLLKWNSVLTMVNSTFAIGVAMVMAAHLKLRISHPDLPRPYRMPFSTLGCAIVGTPACLLLVWVAAIPLYTRDWPVLACMVGAVAAGALLYALLPNASISRHGLRLEAEQKPLLLDEEDGEGEGEKEAEAVGSGGALIQAVV